MQTFTAAVVQAAPIPENAMQTAEKVCKYIDEAAKKSSKIIVFPEAFLGGYPKGASFGAPIGLRKPEGREAFLRYYKGAIDIDGEEVALIAQACAEAEIFAVIGCIERDKGTLYCSALYFDGSAGLVGKHRKLMPTAAERLIWGFGDGSTMSVIESSAGIGKIGAVICWENYMPSLRLHMYDQGISLYCAPTVDDRDSWLPSMRHIALEGRCFVLTSCQFLKRSDYGPEHESAMGDDPDTVLIRGGSAIVDPLGNVLAAPEFGKETILYAEIDLDQITRGKFDFDITGHYARPDVFSLQVDDRAKKPVRYADK